MIARYRSFFFPFELTDLLRGSNGLFSDFHFAHVSSSAFVTHQRYPNFKIAERRRACAGAKLFEHSQRMGLFDPVFR